MKKILRLSFLVLIVACTSDTEDPQTIIETIIEKPNVNTSIVETTSATCTLGGYDILVYDDANSNGVLDTGEETYIQRTFCFEENRNFKTKIVGTVSVECEFGGLSISFYDDANSNSELDAGEDIFYEGLSCYPRDANVKTYIVDADLELCPEGGKSITVYDDVNDNDIPDEGEQIFYQGVECYPNLDTDGDGITDDLDQCNDTPQNVPVDENGCPLGPVYLDENGVTIKAYDWAEVGQSGEIDGITYTIVDETTLREMIANGEDVTKVCTSRVTDMNDLFLNNQSFNQDIGKWDVSQVTDMSRMFSYSNFNQDIGTWDVSQVTDMSFMFLGTPFNHDIGSWDVSQVIDMSFMFFLNQAFNQDIGSWNVSGVSNMSYMFSGFGTNYSVFNQDISSWDVSQVTDMSRMFSYSNFNQDIGSWDVSNVTDMLGMFFLNQAFDQDIGSWDVSKVTNMSGMFSGYFGMNSVFNQDISSWDVSQVTDMSRMFSYSNFNQDISSWDVSGVSNMSGMFSENSAFNQDISSWDVSRVYDMRNMFFENTIFNQDLSTWDVLNVTICNQFSLNTPQWTLPKPNFTNCTE